MSAADCPILTQEDALTAAKRSPPARYLRFEKAWKLPRKPEPGAPHLAPTRSGREDSGSPEGVKKFAQLGHWARRGRGACPGSRGRSRLPSAPPERTGGGGGDAGFPGNADPEKPSSAPQGLASRGAFPMRPRRGPGASRGRMRCPGPAARRLRRAAPVARRAEAENPTSVGSPHMPRVQSPPPPPACPGRDQPVGLLT